MTTFTKWSVELTDAYKFGVVEILRYTPEERMANNHPDNEYRIPRRMLAKDAIDAQV